MLIASLIYTLITTLYLTPEDVEDAVAGLLYTDRVVNGVGDILDINAHECQSVKKLLNFVLRKYPGKASYEPLIAKLVRKNYMVE